MRPTAGDSAFMSFVTQEATELGTRFVPPAKEPAQRFQRSAGVLAPKPRVGAFCANPGLLYTTPLGSRAFGLI